MTREKIEDIRFIVIPFVVNILKGINYEGQGDSDAMEFIDDFNLIFDLAIKALEQEPFINKPCVSEKVCEHDKQMVLGKIRAEIVKKHLSIVEKNGFDSGRTYGYEEVLDVIDKYKAETE